jgi:hypothetical protein
MTRYAPQKPLTEPVIVDCTYITGTAIISDEHVFQIVGWTDIPDLTGEADERRIVMRIAMSALTARELCDDLKMRLSAGERKGKGCAMSDGLLAKVN